LLQDIGILALRTAFPRKYNPLLARSQGDHLALIELEQAELGTAHAEVGGWLAQVWQLPGIYEISLRGSHDPDQANVYGDLLTFVQTVAVAGLLAEIWLIEDPTAAMLHAGSKAEQMLQMEAEDVQSAVTEISQALPETSALFEIDLGDTQALNDILEQAQSALLTTITEAVEQTQRVPLAADKLTFFAPSTVDKV
jgi:hypothetical protein